MRGLRLECWPELVGLPYVDRGRDRAGVDCWGLVTLGFDVLAGIELPSYAGLYASAGEMAEIDGLISAAQASAAWSAVPGYEVRPLDVVAFRRGHLTAHVGLVIDPRRSFMLHAAHGHGSRLEPWTAPIWISRLAGFYRHASLAGGSA